VRKVLVSAIAVLCLIAWTSTSAFAQANNASVGGIVQDTSKALIPGVTVTLTNTQTGVVDTRLTNETGTYNFPSVPPGIYKLSGDLTGFRPAVENDVQLGTAAQVRINLTMQIGTSPETVVSVSASVESRIRETSSSVGEVLTADRVNNLPLVGNNILDLLAVLPGYRESAAGNMFDTIGGLGLNSVNTTIDGLSTNSTRRAAEGTSGLGSSVFTVTAINPDMVGEVRMILAPVDAELGRGNAQVQIQTRSGTNRYTGSGVWSIQNSALNANTWTNNHTPTLVNGVQVDNKTTPDWRNINQVTGTFGGPIIKNKTFFFFLYSQQINNTRALVSNVVMTDSARVGIFRYFPGWNPGNAALTNPTGPATATSSVRTVDPFGNPLPGCTAGMAAGTCVPDPATGFVNGAATSNYTGALTCFSVFNNQIDIDGALTPITQAHKDQYCPGGNFVMGPSTATQWDVFRPLPDSTGYMQRILSLMPHANNWNVQNSGDGLNTAVNRYLRGRQGSAEYRGSVNSTADYTNNKQINLKIDHNFNQKHRLSANWTTEFTGSEGTVAAWPGGLPGSTYRHPQILTFNGTSTLTPSMVNESRFGVNYTRDQGAPPWANDYSKEVLDEAQSFILHGGSNPNNGTPYPIVFNPGANYNGYMAFGQIDSGNKSPLWNFADTLRWTKGKHSFSFGGEYRRPISWGYTATAYSSMGLGNCTGCTSTVAPISANTTNFQTDLPGFLQTARTNSTSVSYFLTGSVGSASTPYWIDGGADIANGTWHDATTNPPAIESSDKTYGHQYRRQVSNEWQFFVKDDFKIAKRLTLNLGARVEFYGSPYLDGGLTNRFVDDGTGMYGAGRPSGSIETTDDLISQWMTPGSMYLTGYGSNATNPLSCQMGATQAGVLGLNGLPLVSNCNPDLISKIVFIGPGSNNPKQTLLPQDWHVSPAVGFAWQLPWFGEGQTTMRGGFQRCYGGAGALFPGGLLSGPGGSDTLAPAINTTSAAISSILSTRALNLSDIPVLIPMAPTRLPRAPISYTGRGTNIGYSMYAPDYVTQYQDNITLSVTRNISRNYTVDVRYVNTYGHKQPGTSAGGLGSAGGLDLNLANVYHNPELFAALENTRKGLDDPLFDTMLLGLNIVPTTTSTNYGPVGTVTNVAGVPTLQRGSAQIRRQYAANLANGNYLGVVNSLIGVVNNANGPTVAGGFQPLPTSGGATIIDPATGATMTTSMRILRNGCDRMANGLSGGFTTPEGVVITPRCFPEDYIITNPQLSGANLATNFGHSNYNSLQVQFTARPIQGVSFQGTFSLTKTMQLSGSGYTDPLNRQLDYGASNNDIGREFRGNGVFELPIGPNKLLMGSSSGIVARLVEKWQAGIILTVPQGAVRTFDGSDHLYANGRPNIVGPWETPIGEVKYPETGNFGYYVGNPIPYGTYTDPQCAPGTPYVGGNDRNGFNLLAVSATTGALTNCTLVGFGKIVTAGTPGAVLQSATATTPVWILPLLENPLPGEQGNLGKNTMHTVSRPRFDANISKNFRISESKSLQFRMDATNILNHPTPGDPIGFTGTNSASNNFGRIDTKTGSRTFQGQLRFTF